MADVTLLKYCCNAIPSQAGLFTAGAFLTAGTTADTVFPCSGFPCTSPPEAANPLSLASGAFSIYIFLKIQNNWQLCIVILL